MSSHYRIHALNDLKLSSTSGSIQCDAEMSHNHANDSLLADLKGLKGTLVSGDLVKFDGSNLAAKASSDFASAASLSDYLTTSAASTNYVAKSDLETSVSGQGFIKGSEQFIQSVSSNLSVVEGELSVDLSALQVASSLDTDVAGLGFIKSGDQYVRSVGSYLAVDGDGELTVDLSSVENPSLAPYLQTADLGTEIGNLTVVNVQSLQQDSKSKQVATLGYNASYQTAVTVQARNYCCYHIKVRAVWEGSSNNKHGVAYWEGIFKKMAGSVSLYADTDSARTIGDAGSLHIDADGSNNIAVQVKNSTSTDSTGTVCVCVSSVEVMYD